VEDTVFWVASSVALFSWVSGSVSLFNARVGLSTMGSVDFLADTVLSAASTPASIPHE
jgi:hypothetical protein